MMQQYRISFRYKRMAKLLLISIFIIAMICGANIAIGEEARNMGIVGNVIENYFIRNFLEKRGILSEDKEAYEYLKLLLDAEAENDVATMKKLFAVNAINELGENQMDQMLDAFAQYVSGDCTGIEELSGLTTSESIHYGKRSKELEERFDIKTGNAEYRIWMKCVARDDFDENNIGIWSIYIIEKPEDNESDMSHPEDGECKTGIFMYGMRS